MGAGDRRFPKDTISVTAPSGGYTKGLMYQLSGGAVAVALETAAANASCLMGLQGEFEVTKETDTGETFEVGDQVYMNTTTGKASAEGTTGDLQLDAMAIAAVSAAATTTVWIRLFSPMPIATA